MLIMRQALFWALFCLAFAAPAAYAQHAAPALSSPEARFQKALSNYQSGQYAIAAQQLEKLARTMPPSFQVEELLGMVYSAEKKDDDANRAFAEAVRLNPKSAAAITNLAVNLAHLGRLGEAEAEFKRALRIAPGDYQANRDLGELYARGGKFDQAIPYLKNAHELRPDSYGNGYDLALAYDKAGYLKEARQQILQLLETKKSADLYNLLADVDEKSGDFVAAANQYQQAAQLDPTERNLFDWGSEFLLHHTWNPAIEVFSQGVKRFPHSPRLLVGLGLAYYSRGNYDDAVKALLEAADLLPSDPRAYYFLSKAYDRSPSQASAVIECFRRFAELKPRDAKAQFYYAMSLWKGDQTAISSSVLDQVEFLLKKAIALDPSLSQAYFQLGILYAQQRRFAAAIPEYKEAITLNPSFSAAYYRLGRAYVHLGRKSLAQKEFQVHQRLYELHLAETNKQRAEIRKFVYSLKSNPSQP